MILLFLTVCALKCHLNIDIKLESLLLQIPLCSHTAANIKERKTMLAHIGPQQKQKIASAQTATCILSNI